MLIVDVKISRETTVWGLQLVQGSVSEKTWRLLYDTAGFAAPEFIGFQRLPPGPLEGEGPPIAGPVYMMRCERGGDFYTSAARIISSEATDVGAEIVFAISNEWRLVGVSNGEPNVSLTALVRGF
jgi:hypothetical protein